MPYKDKDDLLLEMMQGIPNPSIFAGENKLGDSPLNSIIKDDVKSLPTVEGSPVGQYSEDPTIHPLGEDKVKNNPSRKDQVNEVNSRLRGQGSGENLSTNIISNDKEPEKILNNSVIEEPSINPEVLVDPELDVFVRRDHMASEVLDRTLEASNYVRPTTTIDYSYKEMNAFTGKPTKQAVNDRIKRKMIEEENDETIKQELFIQESEPKGDTDPHTGFKTPIAFSNSIFGRLDEILDKSETSNTMRRIDQESEQRTSELGLKISNASVITNEKRKPGDYTGMPIDGGVHTVKLSGEKYSIAMADLVSFLGNVMASPGRMGASLVGLESFEINGKSYSSQTPLDLGKNLEDAIVDGYGVLGIKPSLEEVNSLSDTFIGLVSSFAAGSLATKYVFKGADSLVNNKRYLNNLDGIKKHVPEFFRNSLFNYEKNERVLNTMTSGVGAVSSSALSNDDTTSEERFQTGQVSQMIALVAPVGIALTAPLVSSMVSKVVGPSLRKLNPSFKSDLELKEEMFHKDLADTSTKKVSSELTEFLNRSDIPSVQRRYSLMKDIKKFADEHDLFYKPSMASMIGTKEALARDAIARKGSLSTRVPEDIRTARTMDMYLTEMGTTNSKISTEDLADLISLRAKMSEDSLDSLRMNYEDLMASSKNAMDEKDLSEVQTTFQSNLGILESGFRKIRDIKYKAVDPDQVIKTDHTILNSQIDLTRRRLLEVESAVAGDDVFDFVNTKLPNMIRNFYGKSYRSFLDSNDAAQEGVEAFSVIRGKYTKYPDKKSWSGYNADDIDTKDFISYDDIHKLSSDVGKFFAQQKKSLVRSDKQYTHLTELKNNLDTMIDDLAKNTGDPVVSKRLNEAKTFARDEYYARFGTKTRFMTDALKTVDGNSSSIAMQANRIGPKMITKGVRSRELTTFLEDLKGAPKEEAKGLMQGLEDYVTGTLQVKIKTSTDPLKTIDKFMQDIDSSLTVLPDISTKLKNIREKILFKNSKEMSQINDELSGHRKIIENFSGTTASSFVDDMMSASYEDTIQILNNLKYSSSLPGDTGIKDSSEILRAVSEIVTNRLMFKHTGTGGTFNGGAFTKEWTDPKNKEKLKLILGSDDLYKQYENLGKFADLKPQDLTPKIYASRLREILGPINLASMGTKAYQTHTHKVSKVFLFLDAGIRGLYRTTDAAATVAWNKQVHDMEVFESLLTRAKSEDFVKASDIAKRDYKDFLKDGGGILGGAIRGQLSQYPIKLIQGFSELMKQGKLTEENLLTDEELEKLRSNAYKGRTLGDVTLQDLTDVLGEEDVPSEVTPDTKESLKKIKSSTKEDISVVKPETIDPNIVKRNLIQNTKQAFTPDEKLVVDSAAEVMGYKKAQSKLRQQPIDKKGSLNPKTGEVTWLS